VKAKKIGKRDNPELRNKIGTIADELGMGEALIPEGFDDAIIGIGTRFTHPVAILDHAKCVQLIAREALEHALTTGQTLTEEDALLEAEEYMDHNVTGAYVGESTPIYVRFGVEDVESVLTMLGFKEEDFDA
jgi:hypothetical protein